MIIILFPSPTSIWNQSIVNRNYIENEALVSTVDFRNIQSAVSWERSVFKRPNSQLKCTVLEGRTVPQFLRFFKACYSQRAAVSPSEARDDLYVSLQKGFKIRLPGIVPVSLDFTGQHIFFLHKRFEAGAQMFGGRLPMVPCDGFLSRFLSTDRMSVEISVLCRFLDVSIDFNRDFCRRISFIDTCNDFVEWLALKYGLI